MVVGKAVGGLNAMVGERWHKGEDRVLKGCYVNMIFDVKENQNVAYTVTQNCLEKDYRPSY